MTRLAFWQSKHCRESITSCFIPGILISFGRWFQWLNFPHYRITEAAAVTFRARKVIQLRIPQTSFGFKFYIRNVFVNTWLQARSELPSIVKVRSLLSCNNQRILLSAQLISLANITHPHSRINSAWRERDSTMDANELIEWKLQVSLFY